MNVRLEYASGTLIAKISGEIDHHTTNHLREVLDRELIEKSIKNLILDFNEVSFMDSSGIGVIVGRYKKIDALGGKMMIIRTSEQVDKILELSGIKKILSCKKEAV
ncbi:MAG: anti-sigma F factor antagonist [Ruminococcaceae bacterium]|nr:anti-sigma F factor antagonist [Oscillospiraceae bacterium]